MNFVSVFALFVTTCSAYASQSLLNTQRLNYFQSCTLRFMYLNPKWAKTVNLDPILLFFSSKPEQNSLILETVSILNYPQGTHYFPFFRSLHSKFHTCYTIVIFQDPIIANVYGQTQYILYDLIKPPHILYVDPTNFLFISEHSTPVPSNFQMAHLTVTSTFFFYTPESGLHLFCTICNLPNSLVPIMSNGFDIHIHEVNKLWIQAYTKATDLVIFDGRTIMMGWDYTEDCNNFFKL